MLPSAVACLALAYAGWPGPVTPGPATPGPVTPGPVTGIQGALATNRAQATDTTPPPHQNLAAAPEAAKERDLDAFRDLLGRLRRGEASLTAELEEAARILCREHRRCDAEAVARWYLELTPAARLQGWRDELAWRELWSRARRTDGVTAQDTELLADLRTFAAEVLQRPDPLPGARALSLASRLAVHRLAGQDLASQTPTIQTPTGQTPTSRTPTGQAPTGQAPGTAELVQLRADLLRADGHFKTAGMLTPRLEPLWVRGRLAHLARREEEAREAFTTCLELAKQVGSDEYRERALLGLVTLARTAGNTLAARRALDDLASFRSPSESWPMTREWAADLLHRDLPEEALAFLRAHPPGRTPASKTAPDSQDAGSGALDRESAGPDGADGAAGPDGAAWQLLMGSCALRSGDLATARTHIENLFRNPAVVAGGQVSPAKVLLARATLELASDRAARALELLETTDTLDRWRAGELAQARALRGEALLALKRPGDAREELEAGLALAGDWARTRGAADPSAGGSIIGEWLGLHTVSLLARAQLELGQPLAAALTIEGTQSASLRTRAGQLTEEDLLAWAASTDLGLVTWVVGADSGVAVHIAPDGSARGQLLQHGRRSLAEAIRRLRRAALEGQTRRHQILGAQLRDELLPSSALAAMEKATPQAGMRLLFLLHGPLEELPLALLPLGDRPLDDLVTPLVLPGLPAPAPVHAGQLGAKTKVSVTPASFPSGSPAPTPAPGTAPHTHPSPNAEGTNAGDTSAGDTSAGDSAGYPPVPPPGPDTRWILAGNPLVGLSDARPLLPAAADELALLAAELPPATTTIRGENFTRTTLSSALSSSGALHIATHLSSREVCNSPRLAAVGLVLSHGDILCAEEIAALAPRLSLVVLGACETAQGRPVDAEGMLGLARLFLDSGTRNLLATLWPVEDAAARDFALAFHRALAGGAAPAEAARRARNALRDRGAPAADWAAFRLLGRD